MARKMDGIASGTHFAAVAAGDLTANNLLEYEFTLPGGGVVPGKVFAGEALSATGMEASIQVMPAGMGMPFFHRHNKNEELYIVLSGAGEFTVDNETFPVRPGAFVRIAPAASRSWKNTGKEPMIVLCVQAAAGTLPGFAGSDGVLS